MSNARPCGETGLAGGEFAGVPPSIILLPLSSLCDVGHGTIHRDERQDLLLVGKWRMERVPRGEQADPVQTSRHYFKSCCGDSFRKRRLLCRRRQNWWVHGRLVERSSGFVVFYYKSLTHNHRIVFKNVGRVLSTVKGSVCSSSKSLIHVIHQLKVHYLVLGQTFQSE